MALVVPYYSMWLISHKFGVMTLFLSYNPAPQQILLALPSDYIQTLTTSHHLHGNHPVQATIICCPIYLCGPPSGIFASMLAHYSVDATHCTGEIISKHCHILSFFVSNLPNDFPSYSDQSKSFPWLCKNLYDLVSLLLLWPHPQPLFPLLTLLLLYRPPLCSCQTRSCPKAFAITATSLTYAIFPHILMAPPLVIFRFLFKSHLIKEVFPDHPM